jgi:lysophospholipase L1-like esterase
MNIAGTRRTIWLPGLLLLWTCLLQDAVEAQLQKEPQRFEKDILAFEAADKQHPPPKNATLFVGASNIRRWTTLEKDFRNTPVINRGFGGSYLRDVLFYADRIILPYEPKVIVLQAGGNDLNGGRTPEEVFADFKSLVGKIHTRLPSTLITVLSTPPSEARWAQAETIRATNQFIEDYSATEPHLSFIDLFDYMLTADGRPRTELFVDDKLHVNAQGYELWTSLVRWNREIKALEVADKTNQPASGGIVFVGSSSIKRWTTLAADFPDHPVINHGFGGSQIFDSVVFAHQIVTPLKPRMVVVYAGGNDINSGKKASRVLSDFEALVQTIHAKLPKARIAFISIAGNPARWSQVEEVKAANQLVKEFTQRDPRLAFIDVFPHMLGNDGLPKPDIFVADRLHMNEKGYAIWKEQVAPFLIQSAK